MSLLSKYYYRKYMVRTLTDRMNEQNQAGLEDITREVNEIRSLLGTVNETYESAASGFFASSGELITQND